MKVQIAPSILSADFAKLGEQIQAAEKAGADLIHIDVMDGHFVPNITMGSVVVEACRRSTSLPLDVHLMISQPENHVQSFIDAGASFITIHSEATPHVHRALQMVKNAGVKAGLAVNPLTPLDVFEDALPEIDLALLLTVNPGFGGQQFIEGSLNRLERLSAMRDRLNPECLIEVDGGINTETAGRVTSLGANILVAGSAVYGAGSVDENIARIREAV